MSKKVPPLLKRTDSSSTHHAEDDSEPLQTSRSHVSSDGGTTSRKTSINESSKLSTISESNKSELDEFEALDFSEKASDDDRFLPKVSKFFKKQAKAFVKNFVDYGPPYSSEPYDVALVNECAKPVLNHFEVHKLLNLRLDPNIPDPEDLYFTPIHWCARNGHFMGMKMLRRAGAKFDVTNEMGLTPLALAVMMKLPPTRRPDQIKVVKYLLENGADPNIRDKGGYCAIDHAAVNQDLELIKLLLEFGARVRRENYILVAKRENILAHVYNPECYRLLYEKLLEEDNEFYKEQQMRDRFAKEKEHEKHFEKLLNTLNKKKKEKERKREEQKQENTLKQLQDNFLKELDEENHRKAQKHKNSFLEVNGIWKKNEVSNSWNFMIREYGKFESSSIYESNKKIMKTLKNNNDFVDHSKKWKKITEGTSSLEIQKPFLSTLEIMDSDDEAALKEAREKQEKQSRSNMNSRIRNRNERDLEFRDKNDDELKGIDDLDSFI